MAAPPTRAARRVPRVVPPEVTARLEAGRRATVGVAPGVPDAAWRVAQHIAPG